jgi:serine/threonine-protein kinase
MNKRASLIGQIAPEKSSEVLEDRAREIARTAWPDAKPADSAAIMTWNDDFFRWVEKDRARSRWNVRDVSPGLLQYTLRQSTSTLYAHDEEGRILPDDPPRDAYGMSEVWLDHHGRLIMLRSNPPALRAAVPARSPDWSVYFKEAGLDPGRFTAVAPRWNVPVDYDWRAAWDGVDAKQPAIPLHVEAAGSGGRPVFFWVTGPWQKSLPEVDLGFSSAGQFRTTVWMSILMSSLIAGVIMARFNLRRGRGDRRGAARLATFAFATSAVGRIIRVHHTSNVPQEIDLVFRAVAYSLFAAAVAWLLYIALEPFIRRAEPRALVSSTRLLAGRFRDPMVGRDILLGILAGAVVVLLRMLTTVVPTWVGQPALSPLRDWLSPLAEARHIAWAVSFAIRDGVRASLTLLFLLFLLSSLLRRRWIALVLITAMVSVVVNVRGENLPLELAMGALIALVALTVLNKLGVLALFMLIVTDDLLLSTPLTLDPWYFGRSAFVLLLLLGAAGWGFMTSIGEKSLLPRLAAERG